MTRKDLPRPWPVTREDWLNKMADALRPKLSAVGAPIPEVVKVSCGWPSVRGTSLKRRVLGECWKSETSEGKHPEIFINPTMNDSVEVAAVVLHELIHAARPKAKHGPEFREPAVALGLEGKMTSTTAGDVLKGELAKIVAKIGKYPHAKLTPLYKETKQTTRLLKVECSDCGYVVRVTQKWLEVGYPVCPCGQEMEAAKEKEAA